MSKIDLNSLFKIKLSAFNNSNGWIEPTTHCQLKCPGCYRGLTKPDHVPRHMPLQEMKNQVDFLIEKRNVQTVSIAGGESLLYPALDDLIEYIKSKLATVVLLTNGVLLSKSRLLRLKEKGVDRILIHIDKFQGRTSETDEAAVNDIRSVFCDMFREIRNVQLGFIMPISNKTLSDLRVLSLFFKKNADVVSLVTFTVYRDNIAENDPPQDEALDISPIYTAIKKEFDLTYCAYIPKLRTENPAWLYAATFYRNKQPWKIVTPKTFEFVYNDYFQTNGKYLFVPFAGNASQDISCQNIIIVNVPVLTGQGWDICDGCPDAMLYKGELVPSCLLEQVKQGTRIKLN